MLDGDELVAEPAHLVEGRVEDATEASRDLRLCSRTGHGRQLPEAGLRLEPQLAGAHSGTVGERAWQLLVEQRNGQVIGRQLRVARASRELLRPGNGLL